MPVHSRDYSPWPDKKSIGNLLAYNAEPTAYAQLIWRQHYGRGSGGFRGCPYCKANPQVMGLGAKAPSSFPYTCKKCGNSIAATYGTSMHRSRIPLPVWFDFMYRLMGGYKEKGDRTAPIWIASQYEVPQVMELYELSKPQAIELTFNGRNMVYDHLEGLWGDEPANLKLRVYRK